MGQTHLPLSREKCVLLNTFIKKTISGKSGYSCTLLLSAFIHNGSNLSLMNDIRPLVGRGIHVAYILFYTLWRLNISVGDTHMKDSKHLSFKIEPL